MKYSKVGKSCHSEGVVQWSSDDINGACTEDAVGLGFEVACDFKSMHIAAQSNDIQFCWVAGQISNNEYWAIDDIDVVTQPCDFPKFTISNTEMSPLGGLVSGNTKVRITGNVPVVDGVSYTKNSVYCLFGDRLAKRVEIEQSAAGDIVINCWSPPLFSTS